MGRRLSLSLSAQVFCAVAVSRCAYEASGAVGSGRSQLACCPARMSFTQAQRRAERVCFDHMCCTIDL